MDDLARAINGADETNRREVVSAVDAAPLVEGVALAYPPLPSVVHAPGGPIRVELVKQARMGVGDDRAGTWDAESRVIEVTKTLPAPFQWSTLYYESHHAALDDAGLSHLLDEHMQEALCDATATARMAELRATLSGTV